MKAHVVWLFTVINMILLLGVAGARDSAAGGAAMPMSAPLGTSFTYQGLLKNGNGTINGACDFRFGLWNDPGGGTEIGTQSANNVPITDGRFTVSLNFGGGAFNGEARWLAISVRCPTGSGGLNPLLPRQPLTAAPYSLRATSAGSVPWSGITGIPAGFADGVDNGTNFTVGNGLTLNGAVLSVAVPLSLSGSRSDSIVIAENNGPVDFQSGLYAIGVLGSSTNGRGLEGDSANHFGVAGFSSTSIGVFGRGTGTGVDNIGVYGIQGNAGPGSTVPTAILGTTGTANGIGVFGLSTMYKGVEGYSRDSFGVQGYSQNSHGVYGSTGNSSAYAGYFAGDVRITGSCCAAAAGTYQIDDPLDPANKYLSHAAVQSSEMKNVYDGVVTLDANGTATVTLPAWFEALNSDFRYQLTAIGASAPNLYIAAEIKSNRFTIAGGKLGIKVSWQVTGVRHDPYAVDNPLQVEADKPAQERGKYLYPEGYSQPQTKSDHDANPTAQTPANALSQPTTR
jgi:hypothetical protein